MTYCESPVSKKEARDFLVDFLAQNLVMNCALDGACFSAQGSLYKLFKEGFKGLDNLSDLELVDYAQKSGFSTRLRIYLDVLTFN